MIIRFLNEDGDEKTVNAEGVTFGMGFDGLQCAIDHSLGKCMFVDTSAILEITDD